MSKIVEKQHKPQTDFAVTGLYSYPNNVVKLVKKLKPSKRNELEITDLNNMYLKENKLKAIKMPKGSVWLDAGTTSSIVQASQFVQTIQERQNTLFGSPDEISYLNKFISKNHLLRIIKKSPKNDYYEYCSEPSTFG